MSADCRVYLIGFMGAGKSTVARLLTQKLDMPLVEMDERIVQEQGMSINEIFDVYGEERFREIESRLVSTLGQEPASIVSCGGGVVIRAENVTTMKKNGVIVFLSATPQTIYERVKNSKERPILNGNMNVEFIAGLMEKRRSLYEQAADIIIATDDKTKDEIADEIVTCLAQFQR